MAGMLQRVLNLKKEEMPRFMDATDALAAAYCHFLQMGKPESNARHYSSLKDCVMKNKQSVTKSSQVVDNRLETQK